MVKHAQNFRHTVPATIYNEMSFKGEYAAPWQQVIPRPARQCHRVITEALEGFRKGRYIFPSLFFAPLSGRILRNLDQIRIC